MSNYNGCKEQAKNLMQHYIINIIYKTGKPSHLEKLQIMQEKYENINISKWKYKIKI